MAKRVMTTEEKNLMAQNNHFKVEVKGAIVDKAQYWKGQDGVSPPGNDREKWRKSKHFGLNYVLIQPHIFGTEADIADFLLAAKDMLVVETTVSATDISAFTAQVQEETIDYMLTQSIFETLADDWFNKKIALVY